MKSHVSTPITACRVCASTRLDPLLDLGTQPPANSLRKDAADPLPTVPLKLCRCTECGTVQLTETVDPAFLFRSYVWVTGTSRTAREYGAEFCRRLKQRAVREVPVTHT